MHFQATHFMNFVKSAFPTSFENVHVLDIGSGDINGNNASLFENSRYVGNDVVAAKNVSVVSKTKDLAFDDDEFDTIVSTECFEHDPEYVESLKNAYRMLKPGGLLAFTCASTGRAEHGTMRTTPNDSFATIAGVSEFVDYYRNLTADDISAIFGDMNAKFTCHAFYYNAISHDLYFVGFKIGNEPVARIPEYIANGTSRA